MNHKTACRNYLNNFYNKNNYLFCEVCHRSDKPPYSTHHIYHAGRYPKHPQLHNKANLILLCRDCHNAFHNEPWEVREEFIRLEEERELKELFSTGAKYSTRNIF